LADADTALIEVPEPAMARDWKNIDILHDQMHSFCIKVSEI